MGKSNKILEDYKLKSRKTTEEFIVAAISVHNKRYGYSLVDYKHSKKDIKIICSIHGEFNQRPDVHLKGMGCNQCATIIRTNKKRKTTKEFIKKARLVHGNIYDYSISEYITAHKKVKIICEEHGIFEQKPFGHLHGAGCAKCVGRYSPTTEEFINKANLIHNNLYSYSATTYINANLKIKIVCQKHGIFNQIPNSHLRGTGCPICKTSKGEKEIRQFLEENNIIFEIQKRFYDCRDRQPLPFDFYLPNLNLCIEFDGRQHFESVENWGGERWLKEIKIRDNIKTNYCKNNNINLLRIKYNENIKQILTSKLKK